MKKKKIKRKISKRIKDFSKKRRAEIVKEFSKKLLDKYGKYIKSIVVWGSTARDEFKIDSDIDLVILVDDTLKDFDAKKESEMEEFIHDLASKIDDKLSPQNPWTITSFMKMINDFTPLAYAVLKDGIPVYDTGFFLTAKRLLEKGEIRATPEAAERRMRTVPKRLLRAKTAKLWLVAEDVYYAMIGAEEAVLMYLGIGPPDPIHAAEALEEHLVSRGLLEKKYVKYLDEVVKFRKKVERREIKDIKGSDIDEFLKKGEEFVERMNKLLKELILRRKATYIQKNYEIMLKASIAALKSLDKLPKDPKNLPNAFKKHLIEEQKLNPVYNEVFDKVLEMKKLLNDKKIDKIPERDIHLTKEYIRRFIGSVRDLIKERDLEEQKVPDVPVKKENPRKKKPKGKSTKKKSEKESQKSIKESKEEEVNVLEKDKIDTDEKMVKKR
ncbi:MAG: nucleotidyltransferase domain-containing protein [Candidatus Aenigmarchaeota archaeon]|nr:nucleotidyltransferase domain-containing protein [Candidatus Aenigmarchaeota archaeon]